MSWRDELQQAAFRGVPFGVITNEGEHGRRQAVHEYPFRDTPWVEDLGRASRRNRVVGFLVEDSLAYGGGDVLDQKERMIAAAEAEGDAELVHPTLGRLTVSLLRFAWRETRDRGRVVELLFEFVEAGQRQFPKAAIATGDAVASLADAADGAALGDFVTQADAALKQGSAVVKQAVTSVSIWTRRAQALANDATGLYNMVGSLPGTFGRYFGGRRRGGFGNAASGITATATSIGDLVSLGTRARADLSAKVLKVTSLGQALGL